MLFSPRKLPRRRLQLPVSERRLLLMFGDVVAVMVAILVALFIWARVADYAFDATFLLPQLTWFVVLPLLWLLLASANGFYELSLAYRRVQSLQRLILITLQLLVVYVLVFFFSSRDALPRLFIVYYGVGAFVLIALWRWFNPALIGWASVPRRVLVIGTDRATETIVTTLRKHAVESYQVLGVIGKAEHVGQMVAGVPVLGEPKDLMNFVMRDDIKELVVTSNQELTGELFQAVMDAYEQGVIITPMPILYERVTERVPVEHMGDQWTVVLPIQGQSAFNPYTTLKRLMDVSLALVGCVFFLLLLPFIALIIHLDSRGSIFYTQTRVGKSGKLFRIIKFRSMVSDAEKFTGAVFAGQNDPRITRFGRLMRKTRLDEIPQLLNVLKGEMSLIGPRPERPEHVQRLQEKIPFYRTRHIIPPGLTGWAQVRYHYGADDHDALIKLQYDLYYIRHRSLLLDVNILIRTVGKVLRMGGQ